MKWLLKEHGGYSEVNENKKYAVFIGKFQPYHNGHIELINQKLNQNKSYFNQSK